MNQPAVFEPAHSLAVLIEKGVRFVVIGGVAAVLHGSTSITVDLDICHSSSPENLERLAGSLRHLEAHLRGAPNDVRFLLEARSLASASNFTFSTRWGALDCLAEPPGTRGYEELVANAVEMDIDGLRVRVASLDDLIRMKRASGRPKDRIELEILGALREELDRHTP